MSTQMQFSFIFVSIALAAFLSGCCQPIGTNCSANPDCCSGQCFEGACQCLQTGYIIPSGQSEAVCCSGAAKEGACCVRNGMTADDSIDCCEELVYSRESGRCLSREEACREEGCEWTGSSCVCPEDQCRANPGCEWTGTNCICDFPETG
jgi:hypothetical protein